MMDSQSTDKEMAELAEGLELLKAAVNEHRAWAKESGYSDDIADRMALAMHDHLLGILHQEWIAGAS